jgi:hypothetical protein
VLLRNASSILTEKSGSRRKGSKDAAFETHNLLRTEIKKSDHRGFCWDAVKVWIAEEALGGRELWHRVHVHA